MKNERFDQPQTRVFKHLQTADWLLLFVPMVLAIILFVIVPLGWIIYERASGQPTGIAGFDFDGLLIVAGIFLCAIFCCGYFGLAFILSIVTRRNSIFRILLSGIPLAVAPIFYALVLR